MKRLPADWGDRLTLADVDEILEHFRVMERRYLAKLDGEAAVGALFADELTDADKRFHEHNVEMVRGRLVLWTDVRETKLRGKSVMPLLGGELRK